MTMNTIVGKLAGTRRTRVLTSVVAAVAFAAASAALWFAVSAPQAVEGLRAVVTITTIAGIFVGTQVSMTLADRGQHPGTNSY